MKRSDLIHVSTPGLPMLRPLLVSWTLAVLRYCKLQGHEDNPWWFNERASLSTLAGAAWSLPNWTALEEYATQKRGIVPLKKIDDGALRNGRCDLFVRNKKHHFAVEAKQVWQSIGSQTKGLINVHRGIKRAWKDAGDLQLQEAAHRLSATFVIPYLPPRDLKTKHPHNFVNEWLASEPFSVSGRVPAAVAYVFPQRWEHYIGETNKRAFPGVVLVIERRKKGNRSHRPSS
jgi:hypothetical protein